MIRPFRNFNLQSLNSEIHVNILIFFHYFLFISWIFLVYGLALQPKLKFLWLIIYRYLFLADFFWMRFLAYDKIFQVINLFLFEVVWRNSVFLHLLLRFSSGLESLIQYFPMVIRIYQLLLTWKVQSRLIFWLLVFSMQASVIFVPLLQIKLHMPFAVDFIKCLFYDKINNNSKLKMNI